MSLRMGINGTAKLKDTASLFTRMPWGWGCLSNIVGEVWADESFRNDGDWEIIGLCIAHHTH